MKVVTASVLISILVIPLMGCPPPVRSGGAVTYGQPDGLPNPPGSNDPRTRDYFKNKIGFDNLVNDGTDVTFKSSAGNVRLRVDPENRAHEVDWFLAARDSYRGGAIVAKIRNLHDGAVPELGFTRKGDVAYMWVGPLKANYSETGIAFYKFDSQGNATRAGNLAFYEVLRCKDSYNLRPSAKQHTDHDPLKCARTVLGPTRAQVISGSDHGVQLASRAPIPIVVDAGGLWISCSGGCCDVGGGSFF